MKLSASLLAATLALSTFSFSQSPKQTNQQLSSDGTTALVSPLPGSDGPTDFLRKPSHERDGALGPFVPNAALQVPGPTPQSIPSPASGTFGFNGITNRDQARSGTGIYANTQFSLEPPDQGMAAGNGFVLEAVNDALAVYDQKSGALLIGPTPVNQFFHRSPAVTRSTPPVFGDFLSDPKAYFDRQTHRWFVTILEIDVDPASGAFTNKSHLLIAVSRTSNPTGQFNLFSIDTTDDGTNGTDTHPNCPCFGDQPLIGANANGFFLSTNEFGIQQGFNGAQIYALSKKLLARGIAPTVVHLGNLPFPEGIPFSIQPSTSANGRSHGDEGDDEDSSAVEFFTSVPNITRLFDNRLAVWALSNTRSLASATPNVTLTHVVIASETFGVPNDAQQKAGPTPLGALIGEPEERLATNDQRMQQVVFASGRLFAALTTSVKQGPNCVTGFESDCKAGIAWFVIRPQFDDRQLSASVQRQGYVSVQGENVFYPSIAVNDEGRGAIAFALSGSDFFPSSAFVKFGHDGVGPVKIAGAGVAPEDGFSGYQFFGGAGSARWGDYTAAVADGDQIWFATGFIPGGPRTVLANWGTFIGHVAISEENEEQ